MWDNRKHGRYSKLVELSDSAITNGTQLVDEISLFLLPKYLFAQILTDWIEMWDICRLDSAMCSTQIRTFYFAAINGINLPGIKYIHCSKQYMSWLCTRKMIVSDISVLIERDYRENLTCCVRAFVNCVIGPMTIFPGDRHYLSKLKSLSMVLRSTAPVSYLDRVSEQCHNLRELRIDVSKYRPVSLQLISALTAHSTNLNHLNLAHCDISVDSLFQVLEHCSDLRSLELAQCRCTPVLQGYSSERNTLTVGCTQLTSLNLAGLIIKKSADPDWLNMSEDVVIQIARDCTELQSVCLRSTSFSSDHSLAQLALSCTQLTQLDLNGCYNVTDSGVVSLTRVCTSLTVLTLRGCRLLESDTVAQVVSHCTALRHLELAHITDEDIDHMTHSCPSLQAIVINNNESVSESGLLHIAQRCNTHLRDFIYTVSDSSADESALSDGVITSIAKHCPLLSQFVCTAEHTLEKIRDESVIALAESCTQLLTLVLLPGGILTDEVVFTVAENCPCLTHLNLSNSSLMTDDSVVELVDKCLDLAELHLFHCVLLTDLCVKHIATNARRLTCFTMPRGRLVTDEAINSVSAKCSTLRSLRVSSALYHTFAVKWLRKNRPSITVRIGAELDHEYQLSKFK